MGRSFPCPVGSYRTPENQVLLALFPCLFQPGGEITVTVVTSDSSQFVLLPQGLHHVSFTSDTSVEIILGFWKHFKQYRSEKTSVSLLKSALE